MSTVNYHALTARLTMERLNSYLAGSDGELETAIALYDWNVQVSGALYEDIGRLEVVFRNALDGALVQHAAARGWSVPWYRRGQIFPGRHGRRALEDIAEARRRATRRGARERHGKVEIVSDTSPGRDAERGRGQRRGAQRRRQVEVPAGHWEDALLTKDTNALEPKVLEYKLYAPDVGPVLALGVSGGGGREELIEMKQVDEQTAWAAGTAALGESYP